MERGFLWRFTAQEEIGLWTFMINQELTDMYNDCIVEWLVHVERMNNESLLQKRE